MNFINPIKYGKLTDESSKTYTYTPEADDSIVAPFDGVVTLVDNKKCDGFIQISHLINGKVFYSEICGANKNIFVGGGMDVKKGQTIASCGGKNVTFEIKDGNKDKVSISPFMLGLSQTQKDNTEKKKELEKEKEPKKEKESEKQNNKKKEDDLLNKKEKKGWDLTNPKDPKELPNLFTSLMLTPFAFIEKGLKPKKKEMEEEEEKLNEEILKIKKLLK
jgi:septal ring factor EnvC (AmiA/AmiB activator)